MIIRKTNNSYSHTIQILCTFQIILILHPVRMAIQFHTNAQISTIEIQYVWANPLLATEFIAPHTTFAHYLPQNNFGWRSVFP